MRTSKAKQQKIHAKRRFRERFGVELTQQMTADIINKIQNRQVNLVEKQSNRVGVYSIALDIEDISGKRQENVHVVYDKNTKNIVTVLFIREDGKS